MAKRKDRGSFVSVIFESRFWSGRSKRASNKTKEPSRRRGTSSRRRSQPRFVFFLPFLPLLAMAGLLYLTFAFFSMKLSRRVHRGERGERRDERMKTIAAGCRLRVERKKLRVDGLRVARCELKEPNRRSLPLWEGVKKSIFHPHAVPPPSRGREFLFFFSFYTLSPCGRG